MPQKKAHASFAKTLEEIEGLLANLENTNTPLEESLIDFEKGIKLIRTAQQSLDKAEQKVATLVDNASDAGQGSQNDEGGLPL